MTDSGCQRVRVIDSHTGGEPTRLVINGGPDLGGGALAERLERFRRQRDCFRSAIVNEPRGSDVMVGALLCAPVDPTCAAGVIFFNNVGYLGMCGHGTIGLVATLAHMGRIGPGEHKVETPVGTVSAVLNGNGEITVNNVASYRIATDVAVKVSPYGQVHGDIAWGGNWFFLVQDHAMDLTLKNVEQLTNFSWAIRQALRRQGITANGEEIDHVELFGPSRLAGVDSKNFVLCPGKAYDRIRCRDGAELHARTPPHHLVCGQAPDPGTAALFVGILRTSRRDYYAGLRGISERGAWNDWLEYFYWESLACRRTR